MGRRKFHFFCGWVRRRPVRRLVSGVGVTGRLMSELPGAYNILIGFLLNTPGTLPKEIDSPAALA